MTLLLTHWKDILVAFGMSMLPVIELRGGIIYAAARGIPFLLAAAVCYVGTLFPVPFILLFLRKIFDLMRHFRWTRSIVEWLEKHAQKRGDRFKKALWWFLLIFSAIPLPGAGAWTSSLIAVVFGMRMRKALPAIAIGTFGALCIMSLLSYLPPGLFFTLPQK